MPGGLVVNLQFAEEEIDRRTLPGQSNLTIAFDPFHGLLVPDDPSGSTESARSHSSGGMNTLTSMSRVPRGSTVQ